MFSIRMRAARGNEHISGAERIVSASSASTIAANLTKRALSHPRGEPDTVSLTIENIDPDKFLHISALVPSARSCANSFEGLRIAETLLGETGVQTPGAVISMLLSTPPMRGAMLVDAASLCRLDCNLERGVRATLMDAAEDEKIHIGNDKQHYTEALVLASKVANAPGIIGEICISDDPDYVTGYVASKTLGYVRIEKMKKKGSPHGGRIFLFSGPDSLLADCIAFLEKQPVIVHGLLPQPHFDEIPSIGKWNFIEQKLADLRHRSLLREMPAQVKGLISLASGDYLALAQNETVREAMADAMAKYGNSSTGSRLTTGTWPEHAELEKAIAKFCGSDKALLLNSGYAANIGVIPAICGKGDIIFSDELNHASIIDACRLSGADIVVFRHADMEDLEKKAAARCGKHGIIVSDAIFSMDGDIAPVQAINSIAEQYGFLSVLDEAHAFGTLYPLYSGDIPVKADIVTGSLSKAAGCHGGYARGDARLIEYLQNASRTFIFSSALPPFCAAGVLAALKLITPELVCHLKCKTDFFCSLLNQYGINIDSPGPIIPIIMGDEAKTLQAANNLRQHGILVSVARFPSVPYGKARLRISITLQISDAELQYAASKIAEVFRNEAHPAKAYF